MQSEKAPYADSITFEVLSHSPDIAAISAEWEALLDSSLCNRAFSSPAWFLAWCRAAQDHIPYVIVARRNGTIRGIFPLVLTGARQAEFPGNLSDYNDVVTREGDSAVQAGLLNYAIDGTGAYDKLNLKCIRQDSNCLRALRLLFPERGAHQFFSGEMKICPYVQLPPRYDEYLPSRSKEFMKGLKRAKHRADKNQVVVRELTPETFPPARLPDTFLALHLSRFGSRSWAKQHVYPFVEEVLPALFVGRRMRVFALFEAEKLIGIHLSMMGANSLCYWSGGFLPEAERWSPGKLLFDAQIRLAYAIKLAEFDLMRGEEAYKARWATDSRSIVQLEIRTNTWK
jgi:CelD/BcsL family acetyltransferase involved in cellulose biosynthesis